MLSFIIRRSLYGFTVLLGVVTLVFFLFGLVPDPARELAGQSESEEIVQAIRVKYNLDLPLHQRFLLFVNDVSPISLYSKIEGHRRKAPSPRFVSLLETENEEVVLKKPYLGRSFLTDRPVGDILFEAFPGTMVLALTAMAFALLLGIFLGVYAALNEGQAIDRSLLFISSLGMSGPSFFMAILVAWIGGFLLHSEVNISLWPVVLPSIMVIGLITIQKFELKRAIRSKWTSRSLLLGLLLWVAAAVVPGVPALGLKLPGTGLNMNGSLYSVDVWTGQRLALKNLILPALTLGIRPLAVITQLMRNSVLEVMQLEYVRTAYAKGLSHTKVILNHVIRNAMNPVITAASGWLASMLAGAVFVEFVFGWKGMGLEVFRSLEKNDLPVVMGSVMVIASIFVVINTVVDILYAWVDPRVRIV